MITAELSGFNPSTPIFQGFYVYFCQAYSKELNVSEWFFPVFTALAVFF
ncbi:hypothetical protein ADIS_0647 [Lunatimonas lonarensis]|uniref:Uncharacterized protein n=1 Tax=Lunatimonas lonarensis TaxID=1232681 RepID=R7ZX56_9BACT|nr:hypothetical protein ADIS_0647 [Lunatimonas lonarensis]